MIDLDVKLTIEIAVGMLSIGGCLVAIYKSGQADAVRKSVLVTRSQMEQCQASHNTDRSVVHAEIGQLHEKVNSVAKDTSEIKGYVKGLLHDKQFAGG